MSNGMTFKTTDTTLAHYDGAAVRVISTISEPDETHDSEVLPMHVIEFPDGVRAEVWPDEICEATA